MRVHKRHELVRESRHGAADTNSANVRATTDAGHPAALGHVAIYHRSPASNFDQAFRRAVLAGEIGLLVITGSVATFVNRFPEKPGRSQLFVEWDERGETGDLIKQIEQRLHHVIG